VWRDDGGPVVEREDTEHSPDLREMRMRGVVEVAIAMLLASWPAALRSLPQNQPILPILVSVVLALGALAAILSRHERLRLAERLLVGSLLVAITLEYLFFPEGAAPYLYPVVILCAGALTPRREMRAAAALTAVAFVAVSAVHHVDVLDFQRFGTPLALIAVTTLASSLSSHQLHAALDRMEFSYSQARDMLVDLRQHRGRLAQTVKALEEAYVRIEKMNYALMTARNAAEEARQIKAEFAANISHELRTPLSLILGFSDTMANAPETYGDMAWPASLRGDIEQIYQSSRHLESLINDILDLSALEARRMDLRTTDDVDLGALVRTAGNIIAPLYAAKGLYLKYEIEPDLPTVRVDETRIRQAVLNLLSNAGRFTQRGGVTVSVGRGEGELEVAVRDTGVGISPEDAPKVFEEFRQINGAANRPYEGTGLGVPLSKRLIELHGGRMWLESAVGQGSTFYFTVPLDEGAKRGGLSRIETSKDRRDIATTIVRRPSVLVLEPDPLMIHTLRRYFDGFELIAVEDVSRLAEMVERHQPVALMVDTWRENGASGSVDLAGLALDGAPVITFALHGPLGRARALGVCDYLMKPVTRAQLLRAVDREVARGASILVADDDPKLVELVGRVLRSANRGYRVTRAFSGQEALNRIRADRPDLVLLDLLMPGMSGLEVLAAMQADPTTAGVTVIVLSAHDTLEVVPATREAGNEIALMRSESFSAEEMLRLLKQMLGALPQRFPATPEPAPEPPAAPPDERAS